jgi:riboflavin kinase / FMN adenylyltransferase
MMKIFDDVNNIPPFKNAVLTIGTFDGVHKGHQKIIAQLIDEAKKIDGETVIITFYPHPRQVIKPDSKIEFLNDIKEKAALLEAAGVDNLVVINFNDSFASLTAEEYINEFLIKTFHPKKIVIGYDHRFGKGRTGDYTLLEQAGAKNGFEVIELSAQLLDQITISSTKIRNALYEGDISLTNNLLGYIFSFSGKVVEGNKLGRTIGFPTANIVLDNEEKLIPLNGVYAVQVIVNQLVYNGMMNIGFRPTVDGKKRTIEVNIFDFDKDIYGETIVVKLLHYIRSEVKFNGVDALKEQLNKDRIAIKEVLKKV